MASINEKLNYINETKSLIKDKLNDLGSEITNQTTFRDYADKIEDLYEEWPKINDEDTIISLNNTKKGKMTNSLKTTELEQEGTPTPDSPQTIHSISGDNTIKVEGKNVLNYTLFTKNNQKTYSSSGVTATINEDGTITLDGTATANKDFYVVNNEVKTTNHKLVFFAIDGTFTGNTSAYCYTEGNQNGKYVTLSAIGNGEVNLVENKTYTLFEIYVRNGNVYHNAKFGIMAVDQNITATDFEPYQSQEYSVNLGSLELCKIGDYQDRIYPLNGKWYLEKKIGKVTITGNDITAIYISQTNTTRAKTNFNFISTNQEGIGYSNYFQIVNNWSNDKIGLYYAKRTGDVWFRANKTLVGTTLESVQTWVNSHNVTLYYPLATPTYTTLPTSLQNQLETIYNTTISYTGQTNISQVNNDLPFIISASALLKNSN